jgi:AAA family ATPase
MSTMRAIGLSTDEVTIIRGVDDIAGNEVFRSSRENDENNFKKGIILDDIDTMVPRRDSEASGSSSLRSSSFLASYLASASNDTSLLLIIGITSLPNEIDAFVRRSFHQEIEIPIPTSQDRREILEKLLETVPHTLTKQDLDDIASKLHGCVGSDIKGLIKQASLEAIKRTISTEGSDQLPNLTSVDFSSPLLTLRPSSIHSLAFSTPSTRWSDVGGQIAAKTALRQVVEWPLKYPETFKRLGVDPPKGVLMYGPPGCSKTLIARAIAGEGGGNFLSIKGPEVK